MSNYGGELMSLFHKSTRIDLTKRKMYLNLKGLGNGDKVSTGRVLDDAACLLDEVGEYHLNSNFVIILLKAEC